MRQRFIIGNWKMHMGAGETAAFVQKLLPKIGETTTFVGIAPPFTSIEAAVAEAEKSYLNIGAQNMSEFPKGAYTGEISSSMLKEGGISFVILGHSERRIHFHEDDQMIHRKVKWALQEELLPILCIGESQEERDQEMTEKVLTRQLGEALKDFSTQELENLVIAYEPVWAIGTGKTATPDIAQETHHLIRTFIKGQWGEAVGERIPILYGGSVKPENTAILMAEPDIDGALVGGASLEVESFANIIKFAEE
ncbi:MAG: triose-phosphate isomerase [Simkaniaceae bacterium]|jgi:triosephosphate isomerase|nr:MAG: triose-phosphate isomerase [Simkaniaceae bacterium]